MKNYIHYGHCSFDPKRFLPIKNRRSIPKPLGGFWASPTTTTGSMWNDWCEREEYDRCNLNMSFEFDLSYTAKVLRIVRVEQLDLLPKSAPNEYGVVYLDFEALARKYDAIEVLISQDYRLYSTLFGWDVDTLLVFNPNIIIKK